MTLFPFPIHEMSQIIGEWGGKLFFDCIDQSAASRNIAPALNIRAGALRTCRWIRQPGAVAQGVDMVGARVVALGGGLFDVIQQAAKGFDVHGQAASRKVAVNSE